MNERPAAPDVFAALVAIAELLGVQAALVPVTGTGRAADRAAGLDAAAGALQAAACATPTVLGHHDDGRPHWPTTHTGSIAHADGLAVAVAVATYPDGGAALGIDIEVAGALPAADAIGVLDPAENRCVAGADQPDRVATVVWATKEAAFKAWCEATAGALGTVDPVDIHVSFAAGAADGCLARVHVDARGALRQRTATVGPLSGWYAESAGYVLVVVASDARSRRGAHHGVDGIASAAITNPSAANATT